MTDKRTSPVWGYFIDASENYKKCKICKKFLSSKGRGGGLFNLTRHLKIKHSIVTEVIQHHQPTTGIFSTEHTDNCSTTSAEMSPEDIQDEEDREDHCELNKTSKTISPIWGYFTDASEYKKKCTLCKKLLSLKGAGLFNLRRHLKLKHALVTKAINHQPTTDIFSTEYIDTRSNTLTEMSPEDLQYGEDNEDHCELNKTNRKSSHIWEYFTDASENKKKCTLCNKLLSSKGGGLFNLTRHLKTKHSIKAEPIKPQPKTDIFSTEYTDTRSNTSTEMSPGDFKCGEDSEDHCELKVTNRKSSHIWEYFTDASENKKKCTLCNKLLSSKGGGLFNLTRHLKTKHSIKAEPIKPQPKTDIFSTEYTDTRSNTSTEMSPGDFKCGEDSEDHCELKVTNRKSSHIWEYFTDASENKKKCTLCNKLLSSKGGIFNLTRHLKTKHSIKAEPIDHQPTTAIIFTEYTDTRKQNTPTTTSDPMSPGDTVEDLQCGEDSEDHCELNKTSKRISPIWGYFTDASENKKKCTLCKKLLSSKGGLFNLSRHLKKKHLIEAAPIHIRAKSAQSQPTIDIFLNTPTDTMEEDTYATISAPMSSGEENVIPLPPQPSTPKPIAPAAVATDGAIFRQRLKKSASIRTYLQKPITSKNVDELHMALLQMVVKNDLPFSIVENNSFRQFVSKLNPGYPIPKQKTLSNFLEKYYIIKSDEIKDKLKAVNFVALSTDFWTSVENEAYMSLTVHYLDQNTMLQAHMLQCFCFHDKHTGEDLANEITRSCERWGIKEKVHAVTTDNGSNAQFAIALTEWKQVLCFAHTLYLCVQAAIEEIKDTRDRIKSIVELFRRDPLAAERLSKMQQHLGEKKVKVKQDVVNRWNSTFDMFVRVIEIQTSLILMLASDYPRVQNLESEDLEIMLKTCEVLEPFKTITERMSTEKVTVSEIITLSHLLLQQTIKIVDTPGLPQPVHLMAQKLIVQLQNRFSRIDEDTLFAISTVLDPRLKKYGFPESRLASYRKAQDLLYDLAAQVVLPSSSSQSITETASTSSASASTADPSVNIWAEFDNRVSGCLVRSTNPKTSSIVEVDKYLEEPLLERQRDPFRWWDENKHFYPRLYQLVLQRFCVPVSSVSSDRVQMISDRKSRLLVHKEDTELKLLFLSFNMK